MTLTEPSTRTTRAFCVGQAKSGTASLCGLVSGNYRAAHEPERAELLDMILQESRDEVGQVAFQSYLVERDLRLNLEFDIAWANQFILGHPLMPEMPVNLLDPSHNSFIEQIIPTLQQRNIALLAMKTLADGRFFPKKIKLDKVQWETDKSVVPDRVSVEQAPQFVWSLPVSVLITGAENADLMREKIALAHDFVGLTQRDRQVHIDEVADLAEDGKIEYFKKIV